MTLENKILARIKEQKVTPTGKAYFMARDYAIWGVLAVLVAALGVAAGMIIFMVQSANDATLLNKLGLSGLQKLAVSVPYFWIVVALFIGLIAYASFRTTRRGYKMSRRQAIVIAVIAAAGLGSLTYAFNIAEYLDEAASNNIPLYNSVVPINSGTWFDPANGLLSGIVKEKESDDSFTLRDHDSELWNVTGKDILVPESYQFHPGDRIKIIGEKTGDYEFRAQEVHPWSD